MNKTLLFLNLCTTSSILPKFYNTSGISNLCYSSRKFTSIMSGEDAVCQPLTENFTDWCLNYCPRYNQLPFDDIKLNYVRANVKNAIFSITHPTPLTNNVRIVCHSKEALTTILDLKPTVTEQEEFVAFISGKQLPRGALPVSHRYGGHQFGYWAGQLGDGRALLVGEYTNRIGEKWELQLKGSGPTPYSREGDGRAVLRSSIREMVVSEAFFHLGIPTTRAAALVVSDDPVMRDMFYSGNAIPEKAAVVLRLAPSWFRIGSLEILARTGEFDILRRLCDFIINEHYPEISLQDENRLIRFFTEVAHRSLNLVAQWQGYGFAHGVLNTDNMSILGLTIDFGPFGFTDSYDSGYVPNHSDDEGRYSLGKQLEVVLWNLGHLAGSLSPLLSSSQKVHASHIMKSLESFGKNKILQVFLCKIGLKDEHSGQWGDEQIVEKLLEMMQETGADFTMVFWQLGELDPSQLTNEAALESKWALKRLSSHSSWPLWVDSYRERLAKGRESGGSSSVCHIEEDRKRRMHLVNPRYVPRNWMLQDAIAAAEKDDFSKVKFLMEVIRKPFTINEEAEKLGYASEPPSWAYRLKLSCSS